MARAIELNNNTLFIMKKPCLGNYCAVISFVFLTGNLFKLNELNFLQAAVGAPSGAGFA